METDKYLKRDTVIVAGLIFISAFGENALTHIGYIGIFRDPNDWTKPSGDSEHNVTLFELYYKNSHESWNVVFGYHWFLSILAFLEHKWFLYSWNYVDALIIILARAIYFQFKAIHKNAMKQIKNITKEVQTVEEHHIYMV